LQLRQWPDFWIPDGRLRMPIGAKQPAARIKARKIKMPPSMTKPPFLGTAETDYIGRDWLSRNLEEIVTKSARDHQSPGRPMPFSVRIALPLIACAVVSGCLLNAVHPITYDHPQTPDSNHSIVVIGVGLDVPWPYNNFPVVLDEYSLKSKDLTGNCFLYNRIEAIRPSASAPVRYFVFEVPASAYTYGAGNVNARLPASPNASGFIAPAGKM
jgi:hypothetical protein